MTRDDARDWVIAAAIVFGGAFVADLFGYPRMAKFGVYVGVALFAGAALHLLHGGVASLRGGGE